MTHIRPCDVNQEVKDNKMASHLDGGGKGKDKNQIMEVSTTFFKDFICYLVQQHGDSSTVVTREQLSDPNHRKLAWLLCHIGDEFQNMPNESCLSPIKDTFTGIAGPDHKKHALWKIADELDGNLDLQRMLNNPSLSPTTDTFMSIAEKIFSDGKFNWGRVAVLQYLACRLVIKALKNQVSDITNNIINWPIVYLRENAINWMREHGGWEGIHSHYSTPTWQTVGVFLAGALNAAVVIYKN